MAGLWFSPNIPVSSTNKTNRHDITEILLKVTLNILNQANQTAMVDNITNHNMNHSSDIPETAMVNYIAASRNLKLQLESW